MVYWIGLSDFYDTEWMPFITYFDSFKDLRDKLDGMNFKAISKQMEMYNIGRKANVISKWQRVLNRMANK